ncbi:MAG: transporter substrate-binding domain-containing protein [Chloroflexi bacterium]|jgi:polar amino acid transport system substrate-binding protein|nr:transporter substrate-binding domain-containing protein [Chloroflexota bacterium]
MTGFRRFATLLAVAGLVLSAGLLSACSSSNETLLDKVTKAGKIVMSTDPQYPPQSELKDDGSYQGFDIDVGNEIASRLGVTLEYATPKWEVVTAGGWSGRWDFSVGSMTITTQREASLAFSTPYYYTPAQMAASTVSGITTLDGLAGKKVCVGAATTYFDWLEGTIDLGTYASLIKEEPPTGATAVTLDTDRFCADTIKAGRKDFEGWLSSSTTVADAIADGLPLIAVGDPVYFEPLAVAFDKSGPDPASMVTKVNEILETMRADGTLKAFSEKWFGTDLTVAEGD